jgi:hypothetical protein
VSDLRDVRAATCPILDAGDGVAGTGFFVLPDGLLVTCHHVIDGLADLRVALPGEETARRATYEAERSDSRGDIAVLSVEGAPPGCVQLARAREGVRAIGWGFRPSEHATEPEGHPFDGTLGSEGLISFPPPAPAPAGAGGAPRPWAVDPGGPREGVVHVFSGAGSMERGISGGPVYDPELRAVVGVFRAVEGTELAYVIPIDQVLAGWPELEARNREEVADDAIDELARTYAIQPVAKGAPLVQSQGRRYFADLFGRHRTFGGRGEELARLEGIVDEGGGRYAFVTGAAGFGKTALLANFAERLAAREAPVPTAVHFVTPRIEGASEEFFLDNLCRQLLVAHGLGGTVPSAVRDLRLLYADLLRLSAPDASGLVVVVDGLDEAIGRWTAEPQPGIFPPDLAPNVTVVFSARTMADRDWLDELEIDLPPERVLTLERLDAAGVEDALERSSLEIEDRDAAAARLYELSEGDPFYLQDLLAELRKSGGDLASLEGLPVGHSAYLEEWWKAGREQAGAEAFADLMGTLATARAPLARRELLDISAEDALEGKDFDALIAGAARYVEGTKAGGYALTHGRIRSFVEETLTDTIATYRARLADYCLRWDEPGLDDRARDYMLLHGAEHLAEARGPGELQGLLSARWIAAKWSRFGTYSGLVHDLDVAAAAAAAADPPDLAAVGGMAVARQTARDLMLDFPTQLLELWVRLGETDRVLALLAALTETKGRAVEPLIAVASALIAQAGEGGREGDAARSADLAAELLGRALGMVPLVRNSSGRLEALAAIADLLSDDRILPDGPRRRLLAQGRDAAEGEWEPELRAAALGLAAGALATSEADRADAARMLAEARSTRERLDEAPARAVATAYALDAVRRLEPQRLPSVLQAELERPEGLFSASSLDGRPAATLIVRWRPGAPGAGDAEAPALLAELAGQCVARKDGFVLGHVVSALLAVGEGAAALERVRAMTAESAMEGARALHEAAAALHEVDPQQTAEWLERAGELTGQEHHDMVLSRGLFAAAHAEALAGLGRWDAALELLATVRPQERTDPLCRCIAVAMGGAGGRATVARLVEIGADGDADGRARVMAAAAAAVLGEDRAEAEGYAARAAAARLRELPEGDTDALRGLLAAALHEEGDHAEAAEACAAMTWLPNATGALATLIELDPANAGAASAYADRIVAILREAGDDAPLRDDALAHATRAARTLAEAAPATAAAVIDYLGEVAYYSADDYVRGTVGAAAARARVDPEEGAAALDAAIARAGGLVEEGYELGVHAVAGIYDELARAGDALAPARLEALLDGVRALSARFGDPDDAVRLGAGHAGALSRIDPPAAVASFRDQVAAVGALRTLSSAAPSFIRMLSEFTGGLAGPRYAQAQAVSAVGRALVTSALPAEDAAPLVADLGAQAAAIESQPDRAQALANLFACCREGTPELHERLGPAYDAALDAAERLERAEFRAHAVEAAVEAFCRFDDLERARAALGRVEAGDARDGMESTVDIAAQRIEVGELSPFERVYVDRIDPRLPYAALHAVRVEDDTAGLALAAAEALASDDMRAERVAILSDWVPLLCLPARELGGAAAVAAIVDAVEGFDRRLVEAASLIAGD